MATNDIVINFKATDGVSPALKSMESNVIRFVGAISAAVAAVSTIAFPVVSSAAYQRELLEAAKTTNFTREQTDGLRIGLTELSTQIDVTAVDLAKIAAMGGQLGIGSGGNTSALLSFTEEIARAVTALDIPAEEAAVSLGKLINIFNIPADQFKNAISSLNEVSNVSNATASELFDVSRRIGNLGGSVSFPQAVALSATMIDLGLTAETAGTTLTKIFANMKAKAGDFANFVGVSTGEWTNIITTDGVNALNKYIERLNKVPAAYAAQQKIALTGGGRLFEAVSKLQEQQKRGDILNNKSIQLQQTADKLAQKTNRSTDEDTRLAVLTKQAASLADQATKVNALSRLIGSAESAFKSGTSAQREQQLVLGGLSRQWQVFQNNLTAFGFVIGDSFLQPLTDGLKSMSAGLTDINTLDTLKKSIAGIVSTVSAATAAFKAMVSEVSSIKDSTGFDIGAALRIGAAASAVALLTFGFTLLKAGVASLVGKLPALAGLSKFFFGAAVSAKATKDEVVRTAGALGRLATSATAYVVKQQNMVQVQAAINTGMARTATLQAEIAAAATRHAALLAAQPARLQTIAAMEAKLLTLEARRTAALAAGDAAGVARNTRQLATINATIAALNAESIAIERNTLLLAEQSATLVAERALLNDMVAATSRWEIALRRVGSAGSVALAAVSREASRLGARMLAAIPPRVTSSATYAKMVAGWNSVTVAAKVTTGVLVQMGIVLGGLAARMAGTTALFTAGMGKMAFAAAATATAIKLVGKAFGAVVGLLSRAVSFAFFAYLAYEILDMLGLLDKLKAGLKSLLISAGVDEALLPDWLSEAKDMDKLIDRTDEQKDALKSLTAEAEKYNAEIASRNALLAYGDDKDRGFTFDKENPGAQRAAVSASRDAVSKAQAAELLVAQRIADQEDALIRKVKERGDLVKKIAFAERTARQAQEGASLPVIGPVAGVTSLGLSAGAESLREDLVALNASIKLTQDGIAALAKTGDELQTNADSVVNLAGAMFDASEGAALFKANADGTISSFEQWAIASKNAEAATNALNRAEEEYNQVRASAGDDAAKREEDASASLATAKNFADQQVEIARGLADRLRGIAPGQNVEELIKIAPSSAPDIARKIAKAFNEGTIAFTATAKPIITTKTLLDTAALIYTKKQVKSTYEAMAEAAKARAEEAKNAVTNAVTESTARLLELDKRLRKIAEDAKNATRNALNQRTDRGQDARSRAEAEKREQDKAVELALIEKKFVSVNAELAEASAAGINVNRGIEQSFRQRADAIFEVEERYRSLEETASDSVEFGRAQRGLTNQLADFDRLRNEAEGYRNTLADLNQALSGGKLSTQEQLDAEKKRQETLEGSLAAYEQMKELAAAISTIDPVGGREVVTQQQRAKVSEGLSGAAAGINTQQLAGARNTAAVMNQAASELSVSVQTIESNIQDLQSYLDSMARSLGSTGEAFQQAFEKAAADSTAAQQAFRELAASGETATANFQLNPVLGEGGAAKITQDISELLQREVSGKSWDVDATLNVVNGKVVTEDGSPITTTINTTVSPAGVAAMGAGITEATKAAPIDIFVRVANPGVLNGGASTGGIKKASGGYISGAGTATSDSIPAWLSNGEYVMDAHSTKTFGSGFFAFLQKLARSGQGAAGLTKYGVPRFANGGAVGASVSQLSGIANDFNKASAAPSSKVEITINSGGKRATIQAEREQADAFVSILRNFDKG